MGSNSHVACGWEAAGSWSEGAITDEPYERIVHVRVRGGRRGKLRPLPGSNSRRRPRPPRPSVAPEHLTKSRKPFRSWLRTTAATSPASNSSWTAARRKSERLIWATKNLPAKNGSDYNDAMKAVSFLKSLPITDSDSLVDIVLDRPSPGPRDLLVEVRAISVNPVDAKIRGGSGPRSPQDANKLLGWDAAGTVAAVGAEVTIFAPGDEVYYAGSVDRS